MFAEVKAMMPNEISGEDYDQQIVLWLNAGVLDLTTTAEIVIPGNVSVSWNSSTEKVTDSSDVTDEQIIGAIAIFVTLHIGNPPNYDNLLKAYESMKGQMRISKKYTTYGEAVTTE